MSILGTRRYRELTFRTRTLNAVLPDLADLRGAYRQCCCERNALMSGGLTISMGALNGGEIQSVAI
jgi:hypothetical protein